jgi:glutamyl-tRNA synthetase
MSNIRVRFAPSPTGYLHVGGLRTALYNYLFAKKNNGTVILRIEDTDQSRFVQGAVENLIESLQWSGILFDEGPKIGGNFGPYFQSERLSIYKEYVNKLVAEGKAYYCFCTPERLDSMRKEQQKNGRIVKYDRACLGLGPSEIDDKINSNIPHTIRLKIPDITKIIVDDIIRGKVEFQTAIIDDQVLLKSDGYPTYHLANVVDDHLMEISHVIRGEEWLSSTPKHSVLYDYFNWQKPYFAHLPLLLNPDKSKLSKRQGDVAVEDYKAKGFLSDALVNFVALLGWSPFDDKEILSLENMAKEFSFERVNKSGAVFNIDKLNWINTQYIRKKSSEELFDLLKAIFHKKELTMPPFDYMSKVINLLKERVVVLDDFINFAPYFYSEPTQFDETYKAKHWNENTNQHLTDICNEFKNLNDFTLQSIEKCVREYSDKMGIKPSLLIHPLRYAVTGKSVGPGLFELLEVLGRDKVIERILSQNDH